MAVRGVLAIFVLLTPFVTSAATFTQPLMLGSTGAQVLELQRMLNRDLSTQVAASGPGSPGNETSYFGPATRRAVIKFQEKYREEILAPNNLMLGTGVVGVSTRAVLERMALGQASHSPSAVVPAMAAVVPQSSAPINPNLENLAAALEAAETVARKQGYSSADILTLKAQITAVAATTTDLRAVFEKVVTQERPQPVTSLKGSVMALLQRAARAVMPERARAAIGAPFGGALLFATPCNGGVWNIVLTPLPPLFPVLLSYQSGSQAFLSYNIPFTRWLLGEYEPVPMAYCWIGIYPYPSEGIITPVVGSSLL